jgi:chaperonin GroES
MRVASEVFAMGYNFPHERILVLRDPDEETSRGGIIIPDKGKVKQSKGTIIAIGNAVEVGENTELGKVKVLDRIIFTKYNPVLITLLDSNGDDIELLTMHAADLYVTWSDARLA